MKLTRIIEKQCPVCGCSSIISESISRDELDKDDRPLEHREFYCGFVYKSGKYSMSEIDKDCPLRKDIEDKRSKRKIAAQTVLEYINKLDVDKSFKDRLKGSVNSISVYF